MMIRDHRHFFVCSRSTSSFLPARESDTEAAALALALILAFAAAMSSTTPAPAAKPFARLPTAVVPHKVGMFVPA